MNDRYVHEMDWATGSENKFSKLSNYRRYQYDLISRHIGKNILEIGTGDKSFSEQIALNKKEISKFISIEPSVNLFDSAKENKYFPDNFQFLLMDMFDFKAEIYGKFDTVIMVHVLEHIEDDFMALNHIHSLLNDDGKLLIQVPAIRWLYSDHDKSLGHYRRYNKNCLKRIIDPKKYKIQNLWYQDPIGVLGSLYYFKLRKIKLKSDEGLSLFQNQGQLYDKYIIPLEGFIENYITFPVGLSLTAVLQKR